MREKGNVVPFERPASYWAAKARRHYRPDGLPEAARLMRKALEKSGDPYTALELARIYGSMECYSAAERYLVQSVARGGLTGGICLEIARCALGRGEEALAERALDACLRLDPDSRYADEAQSLLESYPWFWESPPPRSARGEVWLRRAQRKLMEGNVEEAKKLSLQAFEKYPSWQNAMMAGTLMPPEKALPYLKTAARKQQAMPMPHLLYARALYLCGQAAAADRELQAAFRLCKHFSHVESCCVMALEMERAKQALSLVEEHLSLCPASADYLRLKFLCQRRLTEGDESFRTLETLLEIDPQDSAAQWYRRHPGEKNPQASRSMMLNVLGAQLGSVRKRLTPGPLNRLLHQMVKALREELDTETIYRLLPPLWKHMTPAGKRRCDERETPHYTVAVALYLLLAAGRGEQAQTLFQQAAGKKHLLRTLKRFARWMNEEETDHALH